MFFTTVDVRKTALFSQQSQKQPLVVINQYPENQSVFIKKLQYLENNLIAKLLKETNSNQNVNIKIFSDSIVKGIRVREFN